MIEQEQHRFDMLRQGPCMPSEYARDYYGMSWPLPEDVRPDYEAWASRLRCPSSCGEGQFSRYELERFFQQQNITPKKWMGARLGMELTSFDTLLGRLKDIGMQPQRYVVYSDLVAESLFADIVTNLPRLKFRIFSDHNSFCERLHAELAKELEIKVQPLFCATSDRIEDYPRQFASNFDCITLTPLSVKHQVWLDFRKPLNLGPDRCSKLLYAENRDALRSFCAGTQEPDDLEEYTHFFAGQQNA